MRERAPAHEANVSGYGSCSTCKKRVLWATNASSGKPHPFDPEPNLTRGDWLLDDDDRAHQLTPATAAAMRHLAARDREPLYLSHFDSCGRRSEHRRNMPPRSVCGPG